MIQAYLISVSSIDTQRWGNTAFRCSESGSHDNSPVVGIEWNAEEYSFYRNNSKAFRVYKHRNNKSTSKKAVVKKLKFVLFVVFLNSFIYRVLNDIMII